MSARGPIPAVIFSMTCSETIVNVRDFDAQAALQDVSVLEKKKGGKRGKHRARRYLDILCAFDIETSTLHHVRNRAGEDTKQAVMWIWQFQFGDACTVIGRTWEEYRQMCAEIDKACREKDAVLVVWVHNLSFEFQFLSGVFPVSDEQVFATKKRKVLRLDIGSVEYRDSYLQTNMSLGAFTHKMGVAHGKLAGELDYKKLRFPWTPVDDRELAYCVNDVRGLVEAIAAEMKFDGDDLYTIPMTSTGYVRRDVKRAMYPIINRVVKPLLPGPDLYKLLVDAFWGGDTHANRYYVGQKLEGVKSDDKSSAYPGAQCCDLFPMSPFRREEPTPDRLRTLLRRRRAVVCRIVLYNVRQKYTWWGFPYIPRAKCSIVERGMFDNGRILSCDACVLACTDVDLEIISKEYVFDGIRVLEMYSASYGRLPKPYVDVAVKYFGIKTALKGVAGQELYYMMGKKKLNSCYGMAAQRPVREEVVYTGSTFETIPITDDDLPAKLEEAYKSAFLPYQWAVWTTANVRRSLKDAQWLCGDRGVYCDTDCVKHIGDVDFSEINRRQRARAKAAGGVATDPAGVKHYLGVFEPEREYAEFMTWGAKKYAATYEKGGPIEITIAGVNKRKGGPELDTAGGFKAFKPGFVFRDAGGTDLIYNDDPDCYPLMIDGHRLEITRNVVLSDGEYTLGITMEYAALIGYEMECENNESIGGL